MAAPVGDSGPHPLLRKQRLSQGWLCRPAAGLGSRALTGREARESHVYIRGSYSRVGS